MSEWKECKLGDVMTFGNGKVRPKTQGLFPVYGGNGVLGYCNQFNYEGETIVIGRVGAYCGSVYYENKPIWVSDNALAAKPKGTHNTKFLYYYLKNLGLNQFAEGSSHPLVTQTLLNSIDIEIPTCQTEQSAISSVLSSFDDKIDLLHRQNKTLEAMAETLFRQWFVEEADEGWKEGKIGDLFTLQRGYDLPTQSRVEGQIPVISASGMNGFHSEFRAKAPGVVTGRSGLLGEVFYIMEDYWPLNTTLFIKDYKAATPLYSYFFLKTLDLRIYNAGSAVPTLNRNHIHEQEVLIPPKDLIVEFEVSTANLFVKVKKNAEQIKTLEKLRDTLLPKLMSGEVRVNV